MFIVRIKHGVRIHCEDEPYSCNKLCSCLIVIKLLSYLKLMHQALLQKFSTLKSRKNVWLMYSDVKCLSNLWLKDKTFWLKQTTNLRSRNLKKTVKLFWKGITMNVNKLIYKCMENLGLHLRTATVHQNINLNSLLWTFVSTPSITLMADGGI